MAQMQSAVEEAAAKLSRARNTVRWHFIPGLVMLGLGQWVAPSKTIAAPFPFFGGEPFAGSSPIARTLVTYPSHDRPGTIVINTAERRLYYILANNQAIRYGIGVGRPGFAWGGIKRVSAKKEWPDWTPPTKMLRRRPDLPRYMQGGPENPLGARALYLGSTLFRIHGSNEPETIGQAVSSGCFRMTNEDVIDLYARVSVGAKVYILQQ
jgi:lipoprotein-anchoring transpeptidase ErfK/SrfK